MLHHHDILPIYVVYLVWECWLRRRWAVALLAGRLVALSTGGWLERTDGGLVRGFTGVAGWGGWRFERSLLVAGGPAGGLERSLLVGGRMARLAC